MKQIDFEQLEIEFLTFTSRHFEKPEECRNVGQVQFYIKELYIKIGEFNGAHHFIPKAALMLLGEYKTVRKKLIHRPKAHLAISA